MAVYADFDKARNVMAMFYPTEDCTYGDLLCALSDLKMRCCCSPVHDKDKFTALDVKKWITNHTDKETGEIPEEVLQAGIPKEGQHKKKHVHIMLLAEGPQQPIWFQKELAKRGINISYFEKVNSISSMMRYFAHLDNPEKAHYSAFDIHGFGGIDLSPLSKVSKVSNTMTLLEVMDYAEDNCIKSYYKLVSWAKSTGDLDIFNCVTGRSGFFTSYLGAKRDDEKAEAERRKKLKDAGYKTE